MRNAWEHPVSGWPVGAWAMSGMLPIVGAVGISANVLSPGLALDLISLWPGLVPAVIAAAIVLLRKASRRRMGALAPLLLITWMVLSASAHLSGWEALPSSSADLIGPVEAPESVTLTARSSGALEVRVKDRGSIYRVGFLRRGGAVGVPTAEELIAPLGLTVTIADAGPTNWFRYAGWALDLAAGPRWNLSLGGVLAGDLTGLDLGSVSLDGEGELRLGPTDRATPVAVRGQFSLLIPADVPARVTGNAEVPAGWLSTDDGFRSPADGDGWVISAAAGSSVEIGTG
jgi:hypothetical protein